MLSLVDDFPTYQFVIAGAPSQQFAFYGKIIGNKNVSFIDNLTYELLGISTAALVTSGTATLETALFKVPQVVCYKANAISYHIAKRLITLDYISLVNLIMDKEVVKELIQFDMNKKILKQSLPKFWICLIEKNYWRLMLNLRVSLAVKELQKKLRGNYSEYVILNM